MHGLYSSESQPKREKLSFAQNRQACQLARKNADICLMFGEWLPLCVGIGGRQAGRVGVGPEGHSCDVEGIILLRVTAQAKKTYAL